jgi:hypothetical protein
MWLRPKDIVSEIVEDYKPARLNVYELLRNIIGSGGLGITDKLSIEHRHGTGILEGGETNRGEKSIMGMTISLRGHGPLLLYVY